MKLGACPCLCKKAECWSCLTSRLTGRPSLAAGRHHILFLSCHFVVLPFCHLAIWSSCYRAVLPYCRAFSVTPPMPLRNLISLVSNDVYPAAGMACIRPTIWLKTRILPDIVTVSGNRYQLEHHSIYLSEGFAALPSQFPKRRNTHRPGRILIKQVASRKPQVASFSQLLLQQKHQNKV